MQTLKVLFILFAFNQISVAQNLGINTPIPTEALDVTGNINVTGTLKTNGIDGLAGQVLMKNSGGNLAWVDLNSYKNFKTFNYIGLNVLQVFTVPANVTSLAIELWGAGGGGAPGGGGGSGGYILATLPVNAGQVFNIIVGTFGNGYNNGTDATAGTLSSFTNSTTLQAMSINGGSGATTSASGAGGTLASYSSNFEFVHYTGQKGRANSIIYQQNSPTTFVKNIKYGNGGQAPFVPVQNGEGGYNISIVSGGTGDIDELKGSQGGAIGAGGGGGKYEGGSGGAGRVIVHW